MREVCKARCAGRRVYVLMNRWGSVLRVRLTCTPEVCEAAKPTLDTGCSLSYTCGFTSTARSWSYMAPDYGTGRQTARTENAVIFGTLASQRFARGCAPVALSSMPHLPSPIGRLHGESRRMRRIYIQSARDAPSDSSVARCPSFQPSTPPSSTNIRTILYCSCCLSLRTLIRQRTLSSSFVCPRG
jgi:hypothetical protein